MWTNSESDLLEGIKKHGIELLEYALTDCNLSKYKTICTREHLNYPIPKDALNADNWFIPESYKHFDVENYCLSLCKTDDEKHRVKIELKLYEENNFIPVLQTVKYIVDTLRAKNIVWGVGRGSSVASYVLFLIGVHKIDSIKYDIPIEEFFKGEING